MNDIPETWTKALKALIEGETAWSTLNEVANRLGWGPETTTDLLATLDVEGWVDVWELDEGPVVTLSALAAERLGVRMAEFGRAAVPRWQAIGDPEPPLPRARGVAARALDDEMDCLFDPNPTPDVAAEWSEQAARLHPDSNEAGPRPGLLIGQGLTPWPGPDEARRAETCPACGSQKLPINAYCLLCDAWGRERPSRTRPAGAPKVGRSTPGRHRLDAATARVRRKSRRRSRLSRKSPPGP